MSLEIRHTRDAKNEVNVYHFGAVGNVINLTISSKVEPKTGMKFYSDLNSREYLEFDKVEFFKNHMTTGTPMYTCTMKGNPKFLPLIN